MKLLVVPNETITKTATAWHLAVLAEVGTKLYNAFVHRNSCFLSHDS